MLLFPLAKERLDMDLRSTILFFCYFLKEYTTQHYTTLNCAVDYSMKIYIVFTVTAALWVVILGCLQDYCRSVLVKFWMTTSLQKSFSLTKTFPSLVFWSWLWREFHVEVQLGWDLPCEGISLSYSSSHQRGPRCSRNVILESLVLLMRACQCKMGEFLKAERL